MVFIGISFACALSSANGAVSLPSGSNGIGGLSAPADFCERLLELEMARVMLLLTVDGVLSITIPPMSSTCSAKSGSNRGLSGVPLGGDMLELEL
jgi:hypothetical protein